MTWCLDWEFWKIFEKNIQKINFSKILKKNLKKVFKNEISEKF